MCKPLYINFGASLDELNEWAQQASLDNWAQQASLDEWAMQPAVAECLDHGPMQLGRSFGAFRP